MSYHASREYVTARRENAHRRVVGHMKNIARGMVDKQGLVYGEEPTTSPLDTVMKWADDEDRGVNANLLAVEPKEHARRLTEVRRAIRMLEKKRV